MKDVTGEMELNMEQATHIARAMYRVAAAEHGVHEREKALIDDFYLACCRESGVEPEDLSDTSFDPETARAALATDALKDAALRSCLLVGYADGGLSQTEREVVEKIATEIGAPTERVAALEKDVQRQLIAQFANLKVFRDAAYEIGKRMGMTREEVDEVLAASNS